MHFREDTLAACRASPPRTPCRTKLHTRQHDAARTLTTRRYAIARHRSRTHTNFAWRRAA